MKKLLHILILLVLPLLTMAQGLYKLGDGKETGQVQVVAEHGREVAVFSVDQSNQYHLLLWDEIAFVDKGVISALPKHGTNADGDFELVDAYSYNGDIYVMGQYKTGHSSSNPNMVLKWNGAKWTDMTNQAIKAATNLSQFVEYKGELNIVGIFPTSGLLVLDNNVWSNTGNVLGTDPVMDYVLDVQVHGGRIYATGQFSRPGGPTPRISIAFFKDGAWEELTNPPFLRQGMYFTVIDGALHLVGEPNGISDYIKAYEGGAVWSNESAGLEDILMEEVWDYASSSKMQCLVGKFRDVTDPDRGDFNFLIKTEDGWKIGDNAFTQKRMELKVIEDQIFVYGNFEFENVANIGRLSTNQAILVGKVYVDKNNNCTQDAGEEGLPLTPIILNPGNHVLLTNYDGSYEIPVTTGVTYTVEFATSPKHEFGCTKKVTKQVESLTNNWVPDLVAVEIPNFVDLELHAVMKNGWKLLRGEYNEIKLIARNNGTVDIKSASVELKMGDWWNTVTMSPAPTSSQEGEYTWDLMNLAVDEQFEIIIAGEIKADLSTYNDFCITGEVGAPQTEDDARDNRETGEFETVDELDPISKQNDLGSFFHTNVDVVTYMVRFQNMSKGVVNHAEVKDLFDEDLIVPVHGEIVDLSGKEFTVITDNRPMGNGEFRLFYHWKTNSANLAPHGSPKGADVGVIQIKFPMSDITRQAGTEICNTAQVWLDSSEWVSTNEVCSKSVNLSAPGIDKPSLVEVYPNPASDMVTLENNSYEVRDVEIVDQTGRLIQTVQLRPGVKTNVDLANVTSGIYLVKVIGFETRKLVVH